MGGRPGGATSRVTSSERAFWGGAILLFAASTAGTIAWCASMSAMGDMPMPGGWAMSMGWMPMAGQTWLLAAASFLGMWTVMMMAMMLPSLIPMLRRYRRRIGRPDDARLGRLTMLVGAGYFTIWTLYGVLAFPLGAALAVLEMRWAALARAAPMAGSVMVLLAGGLQLTRWKARHLVCCRGEPGRDRPLAADSPTAWRHGLRLGVHCGACCFAPMVILLVLGVMDLRVMALVAAAVTGERLAPTGEGVARTTGALAIVAGLLLMVRAAGLG
jgi:predicted metal-binding membrane protein